jgi:hypothetical protein
MKIRVLTPMREYILIAIGVVLVALVIDVIDLFLH